MTDKHETDSFEIADQKIQNLLKRLNAKNVCGHCTARALAFNAGLLAEHVMGSAAAIEMFEEVLSTLRKGDFAPAPARDPSTETH